MTVQGLVKKHQPDGMSHRGSGWVPQRGRLFKFDFPSAKFWVKIFLGGWVSEPKDPPPPSFQQSLECTGGPDAVLNASAALARETRRSALKACSGRCMWQDGGKPWGSVLEWPPATPFPLPPPSRMCAWTACPRPHLRAWPSTRRFQSTEGATSGCTPQGVPTRTLTGPQPTQPVRTPPEAPHPSGGVTHFAGAAARARAWGGNTGRPPSNTTAGQCCMQTTGHDLVA